MERGVRFQSPSSYPVTERLNRCPLELLPDMKYREHMRQRINDPRLKLSWQIMLYGGAACAISGILVIPTLIVIFAIMLESGSVGERIALLVTSSPMWLVFLALPLLNGGIAFIALLQLKRLERRASS